MIKTKITNGMTITYRDDQTTRDAIFERLLFWFIEMNSFLNDKKCGKIKSDKVFSDTTILMRLEKICEMEFEFDEDEK